MERGWSEGPAQAVTARTQELSLQAPQGVFGNIGPLPEAMPALGTNDASSGRGATIRKSYALIGALFTPVAVILFAFAVWALLYEIDAASMFPYTTGPLSHWMVWCAMALGVRGGSAAIERLIAK